MAVLGDSFSSGEGAPNDDADEMNGAEWYGDGNPLAFEPDKCHRSDEAWGVRLGHAAGLLTPQRQERGDEGSVLEWESLIACSGARARNILRESQNGRQPQIEALQGTESLVALTIGGNDAGFAGVISYCLVDFACDESLARLANGRGTDIIDINIRRAYPEIVETLERIKEEAPRAKVLLIGYPQIADTDSRWTCPSLLEFGVGEREFFARSVPNINYHLALAAQEAGVHYMDIEQVFNGHKLCSGDPWVNNISVRGFIVGPRLLSKPDPSTLLESFHPTRTGYTKMFEEVVRQGALELGPNPEPRTVDRPEDPRVSGLVLRY